MTCIAIARKTHGHSNAPERRNGEAHGHSIPAETLLRSVPGTHMRPGDFARMRSMGTRVRSLFALHEAHGHPSAFFFRTHEAHGHSNAGAGTHSCAGSSGVSPRRHQRPCRPAVDED